ncbi:MAG: acylhydrolase, partial [Prevotellaceae bacterium]|nr:acylhydrolase [Prevotellaceae bacterium]
MLLALFSSVSNLSAQDWANLQRFQKANAELPAPAKGEKRVVFIGNSITAGWIQAHP